MWTMPSTPKASADPADDLTARGAVALGVAQVAPADEDQHQRHQPADLADRAGHDRADGLHERARQLPPDGRGGDDGQADQTAGRRRRGGARARGRARVRPMLRAVAPTAWAIPSQTAARRRDRGPRKERETGPGPLRTARGAGRWLRGRAVAARRAAAGAGTPGSGARAASPGPLDRTARPGRGRALAPRPRRGRRTGRHGHDPRRESHQSHRSHEACRRRLADATQIGSTCLDLSTRSTLRVPARWASRPTRPRRSSGGASRRAAPDDARPCPSTLIWILPAGCALVDWYAVARDDRGTAVRGDRW